jgi:hypothetical protein
MTSPTNPNSSPELTEVERVARAIASKQFVGVEWQDLAGHQRDLLWRESQAAIQALSSKTELPSEITDGMIRAGADALSGEPFVGNPLECARVVLEAALNPKDTGR